MAFDYQGRQAVDAINEEILESIRPNFLVQEWLRPKTDKREPVSPLDIGFSFLLLAHLRL